MWTIADTLVEYNTHIAIWKELILVYNGSEQTLKMFDKQKNCVKQLKLNIFSRDLYVLEDEIWCQDKHEVVVFNLS